MDTQPITKEYLQESFLGGINQQVDPTRIERDSYFLLSNGRVRQDVIDPINKPLSLSSQVPQGNYQAIYAMANFALILINGKAYVKDFENNLTSGFIQIPNFQLDADEDRIYAAIVPSANKLYGRKADNNSTSNPIIITSSLTLMGNESGILFQDGKTQPIFINTDGQARVTQSYAEWTLDKREYVPIGKQMLEDDGILYIASPDGLKIYRSVTGRFLDFVVAINNDGTKAGDAVATSYSISAFPITGFTKISSDAGFLVGTRQVSYTVTPSTAIDPTFAPIFGEPEFSKRYLFDTGALNQFSFVDIGGDTAFINDNGIQSFNATKQLKVASNNTQLSAQISRMFSNIIQDVTCAVSFDDYAFIACKTVYGSGVFVYDTTLNKFVSFDQYEGVSAIKQFAVVKVTSGRKLLFITEDNKLYEAFASSETEEVTAYIGEWCSNNPAKEERTLNLNLVFNDCKLVGTLTATLYVDRLSGTSITRTVDKTISNEIAPISIPFGNSSADTVQNIGVQFENQSRMGWKTGVLLRWNANAKLSHIRAETSSSKQRKNSAEQQAKDFVATKRGI